MTPDGSPAVNPVTDPLLAPTCPLTEVAPFESTAELPRTPKFAAVPRSIRVVPGVVGAGWVDTGVVPGAGGEVVLVVD